MKKLLATFLGTILLAACSAPTVVSISELEYKQVLGAAVCDAVEELNEEGLLKDEKAIAEKFDGLVQKSVEAAGYATADWLAAKAKYFPDETEHTKLVKLHFTWCLVGDSLSK
jgi:hypothetical protein